jgi:hypothetical protein
MLQYLLTNKKKTILLILSFAFIFSLSLLFLYHSYFPIISKDPQNWAAFGNYIGGTLSVIGLYVGVFINIMIAIIVNDFAKDNMYKQIRTAKQIAIIELRNNIYKEFISDSKPLFLELEINNNNITVAQKCADFLISFKKFNSHLFDFSKIKSYEKLQESISSLVYYLKLNDNVSALNHYYLSREELSITYELMGMYVIDIIENNR